MLKPHELLILEDIDCGSYKIPTLMILDTKTGKTLKFEEDAVVNTEGDSTFVQMLTNIAPGSIEQQEAKGQQRLINRQVLPSQLGYKLDSKFKRENAPSLEEVVQLILKGTGIIVDTSSIVDDLFYQVDLPTGWKFVATDHSMWNELLDDKDRVRANIFYKAAFYDTKAHMSWCTRYSSYHDYCKEPEGILLIQARDAKDNKVLHEISVGSKDWGAQDEAQRVIVNWLKENFPDYENPFAYWDM